MCLLLPVNMRCVRLDVAGVEPVVVSTTGAGVDIGESGPSSQIAEIS